MSGHVTETQEKILEVLADGYPHPKKELYGCLPDTVYLKIDSALQTHISRLRKILRPRGEDIVCTVFQRKAMYQHVRLLVSPYDGRQ